jgi:hypothetical protein
VSTGFHSDGETVVRLEPLPVVRRACPLCGKTVLDIGRLHVPVHDEPDGRGECAASAYDWEQAEAFGKIRRDDPRLLDRAHP